MFLKIEKKLLGIKYNLDVFQQSEDILIIKGWIFCTKGMLKDVHFIVKDENGENTVIRGKYKINRSDVYQEFQKEIAKKSGFYAQILIENTRKYSTWIAFSINGKKHKIF